LYADGLRRRSLLEIKRALAVLLSLIIPTFKRKTDLEALLPQLKEVLKDTPHEIIIVNVKKKMSLPEVAEKFDAQFLNLSHLRRRERKYGRALISGLGAARGDLIITMDADYALKPTFILDMLEARDKGEVIIGSRFVPEGSSKVSFLRRQFSRVANALLRRLLALPVKDISSGFRMYQRRIFDDFTLSARHFDILEEILVKAHAYGWKFHEIPFADHPRRRRESIFRSWLVTFSVLSTLFKMWQLRNSLFSADYDERAYNSLIPFQRWWQRTRYAIIMEFIEDERSVLDIGCGTGRVFQDLPRAVGLDIELKILRYLRRKGRTLVRGDMNALPFRDASFKTLICSEVIEHVPKENLKLSEFYRVLKPGGTLILSTPDYDQAMWRFLESIYARVHPGAYAPQHISHYSAQELLSLLHPSGFRLLDLRYLFASVIIIKARKPQE